MTSPLERIGHQARLRKVRLHIEALRAGDGDELPADLETVRARFSGLSVGLPTLNRAKIWNAIESGIAGEDQSGAADRPDEPVLISAARDARSTATASEASAGTTPARSDDDEGLLGAESFDDSAAAATPSPNQEARPW